MEIKNFTTNETTAEIFSLSFEDGHKICSCQEVFKFGNQLYLHIPEYQKYYDNGYTIKEFHEYRNVWAIKKNLLDLDTFDSKKTCVYRKIKNADVLDILPHTVKYAIGDTYIEDNCIVANVAYDMYKKFRRDVKDITLAPDQNFVFAHLGTKKFEEISHRISEEGFVNPIVMQPMDYNYYPLESSILLTIACILKVPYLYMKFLPHKASKDIEEQLIGNVANIMQNNYDINMRIDFSDFYSLKNKTTYRFFIVDNVKLIVNDEDHSNYIQSICKDDIEKFIEENGHYPTDTEQYKLLKGKNHIRGYLSDEYHEFGLDLMFSENYITKDCLYLLDDIYQKFAGKYKIDKFLFDWKDGFKMSSTYDEFKQSIVKSQYYRPIWKNTQSI